MLHKWILATVMCIFNSCNMCTHVLPDMYTLIPRACVIPRATGPRGEGVHIRQNMSPHVATNMYHFNCEHQFNPKTVTSFIYRESLDLIMVFNFK